MNEMSGMQKGLPAAVGPAGRRAAKFLVVISAPSGTGKTTLCQQLLAHSPGLVRAITCTTRPPRRGEVDGVDYFFVEPAKFNQWKAEERFLEHAVFDGHLYGTLKSEVFGKLRSGSHVLLNIDVQGAASISRLAAQEADWGNRLVTVFLVPASLEVLEVRLKKRGLDSGEVIRRRLALAREELAQWRLFDYLMVSATVGEDLRRMQLILEAEEMRTRHVDQG